MFGRNGNTPEPPQHESEPTPQLVPQRTFKVVCESGEEYILTCRLLKETPAQLLFADAVKTSNGYVEFVVRGLPWQRIVSYEELLLGAPATSNLIV